MILPTLSLALALGFITKVRGQWYQDHNLTPDGYYHNEYHMMLSMAAYGDYNALCPVQTFTEENKLKNFPQSTRAPWTVISTFGPTPSGCQGFTAIVPEMNKALIIFRGNLELEQNIDQTVAPFSVLGPQLGGLCQGCTVNAFAAQGYMECKAETQNWKAIRDAYAGQSLVFSITGHGLGGMHSQLASIDLNVQNVAYYSHAYGAPRLFNARGAEFYNTRFNGEAGERGVVGNDQITEVIPESANYTHAGTVFYYYGQNSTTGGQAWEICWLEDNIGYAACQPREQGGGTTSVTDHYWYAANVGQCGRQRQNLTRINNFLAINSNTEWTGTVTRATNLQTSTSSSISTPPPTPTIPTTSSPPTGVPTGQNQGGGGGGSSAGTTKAGVLGSLMALAIALVI